MWILKNLRVYPSTKFPVRIAPTHATPREPALQPGAVRLGSSISPCRLFHDIVLNRQSRCQGFQGAHESNPPTLFSDMLSRGTKASQTLKAHLHIDNRVFLMYIIPRENYANSSTSDTCLQVFP